MKIRLTILILFLAFVLSCSNRQQYITVKHVKPNNHNRFYKPGKDKRKKRVKYVKVKILKQSKEVKPPKVKKRKPPKSKKVKNDSLRNQAVQSDSLQQEITQPPTNESDSTGFLY